MPRHFPPLRRVIWSGLLLAVVTAVGSIGFAGATAAAPAQDGELTWSVRPTPTDDEPQRPNFDFDLDAGESVEDSMRVRNFGSSPLTLLTYASDAVTAETGVLDLLPADEEPVGVGAWVELARPEVEVEPGAFVDIPFTLTVPEDAESGDHAGGIVTSHRAEAMGDGGEPVLLDRRLGSRVHVRVAGPLQPALEVTELSVGYDASANPAGSGSLHVEYTVTNTGNARLAGQQAMRVTGLLGIGNQEVTLEEMPELLPDHSLSFTVDVPGVWPTFRTGAEVELVPMAAREGDDFDAAEMVVAESRQVWAIPWVPLVVTVLVVGGPIAYALQRQRRQQRETRLVKSAVKAALAADTAASKKRKTAEPAPKPEAPADPESAQIPAGHEPEAVATTEPDTEPESEKVGGEPTS